MRSEYNANGSGKLDHPPRLAQLIGKKLVQLTLDEPLTNPNPWRDYNANNIPKW